MTTPGRLIDVSSDNHPNNAPINWREVRAAGVTAVFVKATEGTTYVNPYYKTDMAGARAAGIAVCAYHFAGMGDPKAEAEFFLETAGVYARMLDYETNTDVAWARTFLQILGLPRSELITYGSASTLKDIYGQLPSMAFPAAYGQKFPGWGVCWQFTDAATVAGIVGAVDEDAWYGDVGQYETLFQLYDPPEHKQEDTVMDSTIVTIGTTEYLVTHVVTAGGHLVEVRRMLASIGLPSTVQNTSLIDLSIAWPTEIGVVQP
jgi:hypothetical protein